MLKLQKVAIIGTGLMGGSIALSLHKRMPQVQIKLFARKDTSMRKIKKHCPFAEVSKNIKETVLEADIVVIATPIHLIVPTFYKVVSYVKSGAVITDIGSVKAPLLKEIEKSKHLQHVYFVGGHPMAGGEKSGIQHASQDLYNESVCILTKTKKTHQKAIQFCKNFWTKLGSKVHVMSPDEHDRIVAGVSHLPHLAAYLISQYPKTTDFSYAAGSFRDVTRVALSDPSMWHDICLLNKKHIRIAIRKLRKDLRTIETCLANPTKSNQQKILKGFRKGCQSQKKFKQNNR